MDAQHLLHSDYTGQTLLTEQPSPDWSGFSRPMTMTSQPVASSGHALYTPLHDKNDSSAATHASCCSTDLASGLGNTHSTPDSRYTSSGVHHNSTQTRNILPRTSSHSDVDHRPQSRHQQSFIPTMMSTSSAEESAPLRPVSRMIRSFPSPRERPQSPNHAHHRHQRSSQNANLFAERPTSSSHASLQHSPGDQSRDNSSSHTLSRSSTSINDPASPLQRTHTRCSHCRCLTIPESPLALPNHFPQSTPAPPQARPCSRVSPSQNLEVLSECRLVLDHLAHAPDTKNHVDDCQSSSGDCSRKKHSSERDQKSVNGRYSGDGKRRKIVEKVVIVYMKESDGEDGEPEKVYEVDYRRGR